MFNDLFWALYLIDVLSSVHSLVIMPLVVCVAVWLIVGIHDSEVLVSEEWGYKKPVLWALIISVMASLFLVLIPSRQTMYMMLGVRATENFTQTEMGKKLEAYINGQMDEFLNKGKAK